MQTQDVNGTKERKNISRRSLQGAGENIMSNHQMKAAGSKYVARPGQGSIADVWSMGDQY